ncbi:MAG TPA: DinB family protein [Cyclobacteriaceae bacterium]
MKSEAQKIIDILKHTFEKNAWHGPSVLEALEGVSSASIHNRIGNGNSIIELAAHMTAWRNFVTEKLKGNNSFDVTDDMNFPKGKEWKVVLHELNKSQADLIAALEKTPDEKLTEVVPGRKYKFFTMIHGIIHHDLYHAGQIVLLKKL